MSLPFEWDPKKATVNLKKHGVSFKDAVTVFADTLSITIEEPASAADEARFITLGQSIEGKFLVVVHAERGDNVRIISARVATRSERRQHEEGRKKTR